MSKLAEYAELAKNIILMICAFLIVFFVFGALNINRKYFIYDLLQHGGSAEMLFFEV